MQLVASVPPTLQSFLPIDMYNKRGLQQPSPCDIEVRLLVKPGVPTV
jgi:hypothetical protein